MHRANQARNETESTQSLSPLNVDSSSGPHWTSSGLALVSVAFESDLFSFLFTPCFLSAPPLFAVGLMSRDSTLANKPLDAAAQTF